jgi:hypothetical protein
MTIDELVTLTNGLSLRAGGQTLVCDRARLTRVSDESVDMAFLIAGTDIVPRLRLARARLDRDTPDEVANIVRRVARRAVTGETH